MQYFFTDASFGDMALADTKDALRAKIKGKKLIFMRQVHGCDVQVVDTNSQNLTCDAMISQDPNIALCVLVADCIPVLFYDAHKKAFGAAHAGRRGSYEQIVSKTIAKMCDVFGCRAQNIEVIFGPSIKKCCYEVSSDIVQGYESFALHRDGKIYLDLIGLNCDGVDNLQVDSTCTCCDKRYFSYRRDGTAARFCGVISLGDEDAKET